MNSKLIKLAHKNEIPEGGALTVCAPDGREIALFKLEGCVYALDNRCPHMGGPLADGEIQDCFITCPWHGWQFDIKTGACENMPGEDAAVLPITVEDEIVYLQEKKGP